MKSGLFLLKEETQEKNHTRASLLLKTVLVMTMASSCCTAFSDEDSTGDKQVAHTVMFWLKEGTSEDTVDAMIKAVQKFQELPMVDHVFVGRPIDSEREVVDSSFGIGFTLVFPDEEALKQYESDPGHLAISREQLLPHVTRGVVYDYRR